MIRRLLLLLNLSLSVAFITRTASMGLYSRSHSSQLHSNRQEDIAKLEAKLRELRDSEVATASTDTSLNDEEKAYIADDAVLETVKGKDMILSEQDLIDTKLIDGDTSGGGLGLVSTILAVVGTAAFLFFFAQVPLGQEDLSRYSATGSSGVTSIDLGDINPDRKAP
jgi:cell division protein FtsB